MFSQDHPAKQKLIRFLAEQIAASILAEDGLCHNQPAKENHHEEANESRHLRPVQYRQTKRILD